MIEKFKLGAKPVARLAKPAATSSVHDEVAQHTFYDYDFHKLTGFKLATWVA